jgi:hypothetical protein
MNLPAARIIFSQARRQDKSSLKQITNRVRNISIKISSAEILTFTGQI